MGGYCWKVLVTAGPGQICGRRPRTGRTGTWCRHVQHGRGLNKGLLYLDVGQGRVEDKDGRVDTMAESGEAE